MIGAVLLCALSAVCIGADVASAGLCPDNQAAGITLLGTDAVLTPQTATFHFAGLAPNTRFLVQLQFNENITATPVVVIALEQTRLTPPEPIFAGNFLDLGVFYPTADAGSIDVQLTVNASGVASAARAVPCGNFFSGDVLIQGPADASQWGQRLAAVAEIRGSVTISHAPVTNADLAAVFAAVELIRGNLSISSTTQLTDLTAFLNLRCVGGNFYIGYNDDLLSLEGLVQLESIGGFFWVDTNNALTTTAGLANLTQVDGDFTIGGNSALAYIEGFSSLHFLSGHFDVPNNRNLRSIRGFLELISVNKGCAIFNNFNLESLLEFPKLESLGDLGLSFNFALTNISGFSRVSKIQQNLFLSNLALNSLEGLKNLSHVGSYIDISVNSALESLDGLQGLTKLNDFLHISENIALTNLDGLCNLENISGFLSIYNHVSLVSLRGLSKLSEVHGYVSIYSNPALTTLEGLHHIKSIGQSLNVYLNPKLTSLRGVGNLSFVAENFICNNNAQLVSLEGMEHLEKIGGYIKIYSNEKLKNVDGLLRNLQFLGGYFLLSNNGALETLSLLTNITTLGGLFVTLNSRLRDISAFKNVVEVKGDVEIADGAALTNVDFGSLVSVTGKFDINSNPSLVTLGHDSFARLTFVGGDFLLNNHARLTSIGTALRSLARIAGLYDIRGNSVLVTLNGLENLRAVGLDFTLRSNAVLLHVSNMSNLASIGGTLTIILNPELRSLVFPVLHEIRGRGKIPDVPVVVIHNNSNLSADQPPVPALACIGAGKTECTASPICTAVALFAAVDSPCPITPCALDTCENAGVCDVDSGFCSCPRGFAGSNCTRDVDECARGFSSCSADAQCTNLPGSFVCQCNPGYTGDGRLCRDPVDACLHTPCTGYVNATCRDLPPPATSNATGRTCLCPVQNAGGIRVSLPCNSNDLVAGSTNEAPTIAGAVVGVVVVVIAVALGAVAFVVRRRNRKSPVFLFGAGSGNRVAMEELDSLLTTKCEHTFALMFAGHFSASALKIAKGDFAALRVPRKHIKLERVVGQGQSGEVHLGNLLGLASSGQLPGRVAVKMTRAHSGIDASLQHATAADEALQLEARLLHQLRHPHIVCVVAVVVQMPIWVCLEFMCNGDLKTYLRACRPSLKVRKQDLTDADLVGILVKVCDALAFLENHRVVHRDIAARNVLVGLDTSDVKLSDLGATRVLTDQDYYRQKSVTQVPLKWMAPEAIREARYTSASDVWAFGVLAYEVTSLAMTPYGALGGVELMTELERGFRLPQPTTCPAALYALMNACWQWPAEDRPTFARLLGQLREIRARGDLQTHFLGDADEHSTTL